MQTLESSTVSIKEVMSHIGATYPATVEYIFTQLAEDRVDFNDREEVLSKSKKLYEELLINW